MFLDIGSPARTWWKRLQEQRNAGDRARLSRCHSVESVRMERSWHDLLGATGVETPEQMQKLAVVAAVLSHVRSESKQLVAKSMVKGNKVLVNELRFRRLLVAEDAEDIRLSMTRIVHMLEQKANIEDLAQSIFYWSGPRRLKWAQDYYSVLPRSTT